MKTKRRFEGYCLVDHSNSPGLSAGALVANGMPAGVGRARYETATILCWHCQAVALVDSGRQQTPPYCSRCDQHICHRCSLTMKLTGECKPFTKVMDEAMELAARGRPVPIFTQGAANGQAIG